MMVPPALAIAALILAATLVMMASETLLSMANERRLRQQGAIEPADDVYRTMRWAYPVCFAAMAAEGAWRGPAAPTVLVAGLAIFGLAKALKAWAMTSLGPRWSFRVLVLPNAPLVTDGPYRLIHHPNYVAVMGEIVGVACAVWAPVTGVLAVAGFGALIRARIGVEDRALGRP